MGRKDGQCTSSSWLLFLVPAQPGTSTCRPAASQGRAPRGHSRAWGSLRKEVQQETFLELRGKESPRQAIQAGPHLKQLPSWGSGAFGGCRVMGLPVELRFSGGLELTRALVPKHLVRTSRKDTGEDRGPGS